MGKTRSGIIIHPNGFMETPPPVVDPECPRCSSKLEHRGHSGSTTGGGVSMKPDQKSVV